MRIAGGCHCGATRFELAHAPESVTYCTCSNCSKRGALWAFYRSSEVKVTSEVAEGIYQWGTKNEKFHFCLHCGCSTHSESPSWTDEGPDFNNPQIAINARLIDDFDPDKTPVEVIDGKNLW